ncbi:MAG: DUF1549 and DUF1553 domain-containing protein [Verrucomicrobiota bacterium]
MDVARYADTTGDAADYPIHEMIRYRDYVIDAFNRDMPYDQFLKEQIAGDILARLNPEDPRYGEKVVASGFVAISRRFNNSKFRDMHLVIGDTIDTIGRSVMGLSLSCARCHDHKFDPVSMKDYYGLYGIFESTQYPFGGTEGNAKISDFTPTVPREKVDAMRQEHTRSMLPLKARVKGLQLRVEKEGRKYRDELKAAERELDEAQRGFDASIGHMYAVHDRARIGDARIQERGDPDDLGDEVPRRFLSVIDGETLPEIPEGQSGRLQLAEWLSGRTHPLTARVMVNRIWQHHFGRGLVDSPNNFGATGLKPTHPELLDWLAATFAEEGWSVKAMHRLMVLSRTYRTASGEHAENVALDPANESFWRFNRQRLEAEIIRDTFLALSGRLDLTRPGTHPFPKRPKVFSQHNPFQAVYENQHRSVYLMVQRFQRHPYLTLFDGPDPNASTGKRGRSTVPLQSLFMRNSSFVHQQAEGLARRIMEMENPVDAAHLLAWGRPPTEAERSAAQDYIEQFSSKTDERQAWESYARILLASNETIYVE